MPNSSDTISEPLLKCAPLLSLEGFPPFVRHINVHTFLLMKNLDIVKFKFFSYPSSSIIILINTFSIEFLENSSKQTALLSLVCLLKSFLGWPLC